jgi:hypothetical protein
MAELGRSGFSYTSSSALRTPVTLEKRMEIKEEQEKAVGQDSGLPNQNSQQMRAVNSYAPV